MKLKSTHISLLILIIIFGSISLSSIAGVWKTTSSKTPIKYSSGEFQGQYNPADIRGSYTFNDVSIFFDIPLEDLSIAFGINEIGPYRLGDLESIYIFPDQEDIEIGTGSIKYFVALYKNLPYELTEITYLPKSAIDILKEKANITVEQIASIEEYSVDLNEIAITNIVPEVSENADVHEEKTDKIIKGNTTFKDLLDWSVKKEDIEKVIGNELPNPLTIIKDYSTEKKLSYSNIKISLQELVNKTE